MSDDPAPATFTGRARRRKTRRSVKIADAVAKYGITAGGLGVIAALALIIVFLVRVVVPLFGDAETERRLAAPLPSGQAAPVAMGLDRNLNGLWTLSGDGQLVYDVLHPAGEDEGQGRIEPLVSKALGGEDAIVTAVSVDDDAIAVGLASGKVLLGSVGFTLDYPAQTPPELADLERGERRAYDGAVADLTRAGGARLTRPLIDLGEPFDLVEGGAAEQSAITHLDYLLAGGEAADAAVLAARRDDGRLFWGKTTTKTNFRTGEKRTTIRRFELPPPVDAPADGEVAGLFLGRDGNSVLLLYKRGHLVWYDTKALQTAQPDDGAVATIAGELDTLDDDLTVTAAEMLAGDFTLIVGDSGGGVAGWFPSASAETGEWAFTKVHDLAEQPAAVTAIALSRRDRQFLTGDAEGNVWLRHMTSNTIQAQLDVKDGPIAVVAASPSNTAAAALTADGQLTVWGIDNPHADGKLAQLFGPVHYEGRSTGSWVWQSSAAGDDAEPKLSLMPLIWGTFKATVYAMLFATPIAILAAIYSAEFMQPGVRNVVKPGIEMMAGLPSVVLGYIAAQVLAPFAEDVLGGLLITFAAVPVSVMIFGFLWQLVPPSEVNKQGGYWALGGLIIVGLSGLAYFGTPPVVAVGVFVALVVILAGVVLFKGEDVGRFMPFIVMAELVLSGILLGLAMGPLFETILFGGNLREWLRGVPQGWVASMPASLQALPGWVLLLTPILTIGLVLAFNLYVRPNLRLFDGRGRTRTQIATIDLARFVVVGVLGVALAVVVGGLFSLVGLDLRSDPLVGMTGGVVESSGVFDAFDPRNALNVGMIMGFAIIPIIYTVSEDALTAVPNTLRSAALGAGATPWQTAVRVVLPVALSGIFSACMIGLGRAVGETMIVLMAAGNTPTMNLNMFDGMRTLSANIATEMPEAPVGGTLYRVLFLSALVLFAMTFLVNTAAEFVRIRFRKRAFQL